MKNIIIVCLFSLSLNGCYLPPTACVTNQCMNDYYTVPRQKVIPIPEQMQSMYCRRRWQENYV